MKRTKTTTLTEKSQRVEICIKREEENIKLNETITNQHEVAATPSSDPIAKVEENVVIHDSQLPCLGNEKGSSRGEGDPRVYCTACDRYYYGKHRYARHLGTAKHKKMAIAKLAPPNKSNPNFYCSVCKKDFGRIGRYRTHLKIVHKMKLTAIKPTPNLNITPNPNNANNHCDSCSWTFKTKHSYISHLATVHNIIARPQKGGGRPNPNISPDIDDPNHYCKSCQMKYKNHNSYRAHLKGVHRIQLAPVTKSTSDPNISIADTQDPNNTSCAICKVKYCKRASYQKHMEKFHNNIQPDPNDPSYFCRACQKHYPNRQNFYRHIWGMHPNVELRRRQFNNPLTIEIDAGNRNNRRCTICKMDYKSRRAYIKHMDLVHKNGQREPTAPNRKININPLKVEMDAGDTKNKRCKVCERDFSSRSSYSNHIKQFHKDGKREPALRKKPKKRAIDFNIKPIKDDPTNHCRSCQKTFANRSNYHRHIKVLHNGEFTTRSDLALNNKRREINAVIE